MVLKKKLMTVILFQVRTIIQKSFKAALDEHDILISPAAPSAAYKIGMLLLYFAFAWKYISLTFIMNWQFACNVNR